MEKNKEHVITEIIEYLPKAVVHKTIMRKITGNITASAVDVGMHIGEQISNFDKYIQIIDGSAELTIDSIPFTLVKGQGIIIPSNSSYMFNADKQFKMISTVIKSGYEEWIAMGRLTHDDSFAFRIHLVLDRFLPVNIHLGEWMIPMPTGTSYSYFLNYFPCITMESIFMRNLHD